MKPVGEFGGGNDQLTERISGVEAAAYGTVAILGDERNALVATEDAAPALLRSATGSDYRTWVCNLATRDRDQPISSLEAACGRWDARLR